MTPSPTSTATRWIDDWTLLSARIAAPPRLLVGCDFDGTLAPIAADPASVQISSRTLGALESILSVPGVGIAVISGRSLEDLRARIPLTRVTLSGNHGLEVQGLGLDGQRPEARLIRPVLEALADHFEEALGGVPGILIEDKGLSLTIHTRNVIASHHDLVTRHVCEAAARDNRLRLQTGKEVLEILPATLWNKGSILRQIAARLGIPLSAVIYIGDDTTDESAFEAVPTGIGIRVGPASDGTAARWTAEGPADVCRFLEYLACVRARIGSALPSVIPGIEC